MIGYLLDTNVFIEAKNRHYGFDFCPAFWDWLVEKNLAGKVASIEKVAEELNKGEDDLTDWAEARGDDFFVTPDKAVVDALPTISSWAKNSKYDSGAVLTFLNGADYWIVAYALAHDYTIVTHEVRAETIQKIKIPNACDNFDIHCVSPFEMLRHEQARFVLGPSREVT